MPNLRVKSGIQFFGGFHDPCPKIRVLSVVKTSGARLSQFKYPLKLVISAQIFHKALS